jgi:hypothetical protein
MVAPGAVAVGRILMVGLAPLVFAAITGALLFSSKPVSVGAQPAGVNSMEVTATVNMERRNGKSIPSVVALAASMHVADTPGGSVATAYNCGPLFQGRTESWISGVSGYWCAAGSYNGGIDACYAQNGGDALAGAATVAWGWVTGVSKHFVVRNSDGVYFGGDITYTSADGGSPSAECWDRGNPWWWDGLECRQGSPIVISLYNGNGVGHYRFTSAQDGVDFDINGDGVTERLGWTQANADVAFLALDRNGNGTIDDGTELFGNHTIPGVGNGYAALAELAYQASGVHVGDLRAGHPLFAQLQLWTDRNHNGLSEASELEPVSERIAGVGLSYEESRRRDQFGNQLRYQGWVEVRTAAGVNRATSGKEHRGRVRRTYDVFFVVQP